MLDVASQSFSSFWISDHHMTGDRFRLECWSVLMWVAARYPGPLLGTCVMANSYRHPPLLAKMVASLQYLSSGRFIFGYGAGWTEEEYVAYGYEFPSARERIAQLDDGVRAIKALWTESPATYKGPYYEVKGAYCEPRPDPLPPLMLAGDGERYMLRVVAEHADWWLSYARRPEVQRRKLAVLAEHCKSFGRDPADDQEGGAADGLPGPGPGGCAQPGRREAGGREPGLRRRPFRASGPPGRRSRRSASTWSSSRSPASPRPTT